MRYMKLLDCPFCKQPPKLRVVDNYSVIYYCACNKTSENTSTEHALDEWNNLVKRNDKTWYK